MYMPLLRFDALKHIRNTPLLSRLPVVILTDSVDPDLLDRTFKLGADDFQLKPMRFSDLVKLMRRLYQWRCQSLEV